MIDIVKQRLSNQKLSDPNGKTPYDVVSWLGAVQAQDYSAAKWAVVQRSNSLTNQDVDKALADGSILRTHIMRPTWHFVVPEDIQGVLALTSGRVKTLLNHYNKKLELDEKVFEKTNLLITKKLTGRNYLNRQELKQILVDELKIQTDVQKLAHIIMWAELDGLICSGPRIGKQFTYALVSERVGKVKKLNSEEALARLTLKYFASHGPAQSKDFAWWSGLSSKEVSLGLDLIKNQLSSETLDGKVYWFVPSNESISQVPPALLLSIYDEYTIAYRDRSALGDERYFEKLIQMGNLLTSVLVIEGKIVGTWKRILGKNKVDFKVSPFRTLSAKEKEAIENQTTKYGKFIGLPTELAFN